MYFWQKWFLKRSKNSLNELNDLLDAKKPHMAITFDDILLEPQYSEVESRRNVDISTSFFGHKMEIPIFSANMDSVTEGKMATAMYKLGAAGVLHRYQSFETTMGVVRDLVQNGVVAIPSIGVQPLDYDYALAYMQAGATAVCLDIAHGDSKKLIELVKRLAKENVPMIAGNVATYGGVMRLADAGAKVIKVGIGAGAACSTRVITGHGVPQISALIDASEAKKHHKDIQIISDGGIRNSGDMAKALAFGADAVMLGSLLAASEEAPGHLINGQKIYRGMASKEARSDFDPDLPLDYTPEGVAMFKPFTGPVSKTVHLMAGGVRSALSYSGANNLAEFRKNRRFYIVSNASVIENAPHGLKNA